MKKVAAAVFYWWFFITVLPAAQVNFSCTAFANHQDSNGSPIDESWVFSLGAFDPAFTPTSANVCDWKANWTTAQTVHYSTRTSFFTGVHFFDTNTSPFTTSNSGYIWGYNGTGEWILITDPSWRWPNTTFPIIFPSNWDVSQATQTIVGNINTGGVEMKMANVGSGCEVPAFSQQDWVNSHFGDDANNESIAGWNADPDGDGFSNLEEYALGSTPMDGSSRGRFCPAFVEDGGQEYGGVELIKSAVAEGVIISIQSSMTLESWSGTGLVFAINEPERLVLRSAQPLASEGKRFYRYRVIRTG